ncbi:RpiB/LacA/LacB family sugar-phosphate isomerase [Actinospica durhamensis]|uniref:RpiB/LacA/LacB family sugar-phosphate isomerase n=1 Tax=Actinospica durhamensis TaxID=1508375 RepID=A0A941IUT1_9ACTN|nr:RpiB/LacA/LacB family sugar-phosphate isomerase [Actinospica durhamensis]MBR7835991.1 RpiB/LacA/LacB family sugar-phosphate isomerase [Actinospica durhamensis]
MRISVATDSRDGVAPLLPALLEQFGHEVTVHGALAPTAESPAENAAAEREAAEAASVWSAYARAAALDVAEGRAEQAVVACWTGTGVSIAANKVRGIRAALCTDAATAAGARRWNDANVLALSLRLLSGPVLAEILEAWFAAGPSIDPQDLAAIGLLEPTPDTADTPDAADAPGTPDAP